MKKESKFKPLITSITPLQTASFNINPIDCDRDRFFSYVVLDSQGIPEKPEFRIDFQDPYNRHYLEKYVLDKNHTVQIRETHTFRSLTAEKALEIVTKHKDCLFRYIDSYDSVTYETSEAISEHIKWLEEHPEYDSSPGDYSLFMDKVLPADEQLHILIAMGFKKEELTNKQIQKTSSSISS